MIRVDAGTSGGFVVVEDEIGVAVFVDGGDLKVVDVERAVKVGRRARSAGTRREGSLKGAVSVTEGDEIDRIGISDGRSAGVEGTQAVVDKDEIGLAVSIDVAESIGAGSKGVRSVEGVSADDEAAGGDDCRNRREGAIAGSERGGEDACLAVIDRGLVMRSGTPSPSISARLAPLYTPAILGAP